MLWNFSRSNVLQKSLLLKPEVVLTDLTSRRRIDINRVPIINESTTIGNTDLNILTFGRCETSYGGYLRSVLDRIYSSY